VRGDLDPDWELLRRVAAGDTEAFSPLVERHQDKLVRLCERLLGEREEARDAAQEVLLKAFRKAASFKPDGQVFTWLYRIAVNHCLNHLRRRRLVRFFSLAGGENEEGGERVFDPPDPAVGPEGDLEVRQRWRATRRAIDALPESQRMVLILAKFEGLPYREIARTLGITEGAVESRLVRAMRRLAEAQEVAAADVSPARRRP